MLGSRRRSRGYSSNIDIQAESELRASSQCSMRTMYLATSGGVWPAAEGKLLSPLLSTEEPILRPWCQFESLGHVETLRRARQMVAKMDRSWGTQLWGEAKGDELGKWTRAPWPRGWTVITMTGSCAVEMSDHTPRSRSHKLLRRFRLSIREKKYFLEKWYRSGSGAWGGGGITIPGGVQDSAVPSLSWFDLVLAIVLWAGRWMK